MTRTSDAPDVTHRAAVSALSAELVCSSPRPATVLASTRVGCYLLVDDEVLPVLTSDALALPTAVRLVTSSTAVPIRLEPGHAVQVGDARIVAPGLRIEVVRTVRPARVRQAQERLPHTSVSAAQIRGLIGRGPGLTPEGDDELAGRLLVTVASGGRAPDLGAHLHRTTTLSASLLRAAAQGYAVPAVVGYVDAVVVGDAAAAQRLHPRVAAIGHSSGPALLRGITAALHPASGSGAHRAGHPLSERMLA